MQMKLNSNFFLNIDANVINIGLDSISSRCHRFSLRNGAENLTDFQTKTENFSEHYLFVYPANNAL